MDFDRLRDAFPHADPQNWASLPVAHRFCDLADRVGHGTGAALLQWLDLAARCLAPGEVYAEFGAVDGTYAIAALGDDRVGYLIDDGSRADPFGDRAAQLDRVLVDFGWEERVAIARQPLAEVLRDLAANGIEDRFGLVVVHGAADYRSVVLHLLELRPYLAARALVVLLPGDRASLRQGVADVLAVAPQYGLWLDASTSEAWDRAIGLAWDGGSAALPLPLGRGIGSEDGQAEETPVVRAIADLDARDRRAQQSALEAEAIERHQRKRFTEAEAIYLRLTALAPDDPVLWANFGTLYFSMKEYEKALTLLARAARLDPQRALTYYGIGQALERLERLPEAAAAYERAIALDPKHVDALNNLGNLLFHAHRLAEAEDCFRQAVAADPKNFGSFLNLGNVLLEQGKAEAAIAAYERALRLQPRTSDILHNLAEACEQKGDTEQATLHRAHAHFRAGNYDEAVAAFERYLSLAETGKPHAYYNLATCYSHCDREADALATLHRAIALYPDNHSFYFALSFVMTNCGRDEEARTVLAAARDRNPDNLAIRLLHDTLVPSFYTHEEEIGLWRQRFTEGLDDLIAHTRLDTPAARDRALQAIGIRTNFFLSYQGYNDRDLQKRYGDLTHRIMAANYPEAARSLPMPPLADGEKLRLGFVSHEVWSHSGTRWAVGWVKNLDRSRFELYGYHTGSVIDATTQIFRLHFDRFHHHPDNLETVAAQILRDRLHILIFLDIGMHPLTSQLAALRLAAVQCTTWGHPITSGLPTIDYFLSGELTEIPEAQEHYSETLVRLPNIAISYPKPAFPEPTKTRADFDLREEDAVYLCCQSYFKYLPQHDFLLPAIAQRVPQAKFLFVLRFGNPQARMKQLFADRFRAAFARAGLDFDACVRFIPLQTNPSDYHGLLRCTDAFLDTIGFCGGHTTLDAIAACTPVVTLPNHLLRGRQSTGFLTLLGVTETIARTEAEYIDIAVRLGTDGAWRQAIQQRMAAGHDRLYEDRECVRGLAAWCEQVVREKLLAERHSPAAGTKPMLLQVRGSLRGEGNWPEMFGDRANWQVARLSLNPTLPSDLAGSLADLSAIASHSFDALWCDRALERLPAADVPVALSELYRVLKPAGWLAIDTVDLQAVAARIAAGTWDEPIEIPGWGAFLPVELLYGTSGAIAPVQAAAPHQTGFTAAMLENALLAAGFRDVRVTTAGVTLQGCGRS